jgi:hypothetical protein
VPSRDSSSVSSASGLTGGRRDFRSVSAVQAGLYELLADDDVAERAIVLLSQAPPR